MKVIKRNVIVTSKKRNEQIRHTVTLETTSIDSFGKEYIKNELFDNCYADKLDIILQQVQNIYCIDSVIR